MGQTNKTPLRRMWVNQPSTAHDFHRMHGTKVLAEDTHAPDIARVWFTEGEVISQHMPWIALSDGWPKPKEKTPLWGRRDKDPEYCRIDSPDPKKDCGCGFGQCEKGLIL